MDNCKEEKECIFFNCITCFGSTCTSINEFLALLFLKIDVLSTFDNNDFFLEFQDDNPSFLTLLHAYSRQDVNCSRFIVASI